MRNIRKSDLKDIHVIMQLIENGREKMRADGNSEQWTNGNPRQSLIEDDIMKGNSYIVEGRCGCGYIRIHQRA